MAQKVTITSPTNGATVSGTITVTVKTNSVRVVNFFLDGSSIAKDSSNPFSTVIDTTKLKEGTHTIKVTSGNGKSTSSINFIVHNSHLTADFSYRE